MLKTRGRDLTCSIIARLVTAIGERVSISSYLIQFRLLDNNKNIMAPIPFANEKSLGAGDLPVSENQRQRKARRAIPFVLTTLLVLAYYLTTPILSACSHRHKNLTVAERATKILSENPLIGT